MTRAFLLDSIVFVVDKTPMNIMEPFVAEKIPISSIMKPLLERIIRNNYILSQNFLVLKTLTSRLYISLIRIPPESRNMYVSLRSL